MNIDAICMTFCACVCACVRACVCGDNQRYFILIISILAGVCYSYLKVQIDANEMNTKIICQ